VKLLTLLTVCLLAGCGLYTPRVEVTTGVRVVNGDTGMAACLNVNQRLRKHVSFTYLHCSDPRHGRPFNSDPDVSDDVLGVTVGWGGKPK
jgi:hypothetical protein